MIRAQARTTPNSLTERRAVALTAFLLAFLALGATTSAEICGGLDYAGKCEGTIIQWCENDEVIQLDCADHGAVCGWDGENEYYTCIDPDEAAEACPSENTYSGTCQNENTVIWCNSDGTFNTMECKDGLVCGWNDEMGYFDCIDSGDDAPGADETVGTDDEESNNPDDTEDLGDPEEGDLRSLEKETGSLEGQDATEPDLDPLAPPPVAPGCRNTQNAPTGFAFLLALFFFGGFVNRAARP